MNVDRFLALVSIALGLIGVFIGLRFDPMGWAILAVGVIVAIWVVWHAKTEPPFAPIARAQHFRFLDPGGNVVEVTRIASYRINRSGVHVIPITGIYATGKLTDFTSNLGTVKGVGAAGGSPVQHLEFNPAPPARTVVTPILRFRGRNCFEQPEESVTHLPSGRWQRASLVLEFHPDRFPAVVRAIRRAGTDPEEEVESWRLSKSLPAVAWDFKPRRGTTYLLKWAWPDAATGPSG